ncbi:MAG TPA: hypothetical protein VFJ49_02735 [Methyloceanibacter sp.]|nr:hypothetical protein [Methyloceanibacter sp.]
MSNVYRVEFAEDQTLGFGDHPWNRRAERFLRDLRMTGAPSDVIAELLHNLLDIVEPRTHWHALK